ncbi:MAG: oxaloacetate-decarboxylating malate dehydrogenase [Holophagales bacterium]|nr:oxaloacetate-decarboxylating malate dehydrogenase [Holophagales bacterium]
MDFSIKVDPSTWQRYISTPKRGEGVLTDSFLNKGTAFTPGERDELDILGLIPPAVFTIEQQLGRVYESFCAKSTLLEKYIYLASLHDRNEVLYYRLVHERIEEMLPIVYTPVVGEACQKFSHIFRRGRGLYIGINQKNSIEKILRNYHTSEPSVIVVTDGERILGLGDQGAGGMGIPIGKLCLYTSCAGVSPYSTLPIMLDVGTDNEERLADPLYVGLRHKRIRGDEYQEFIDKFVEAVKKVFPNVLLQWEDFLKDNAIFQLERFRDELLTFNDDIQGTAAVVVAGIFGALRLTGGKMSDHRLVFAGAGASAHGIAELFVSAQVAEGVPVEEARKRIWTCDTKGLAVSDRAGLEGFKKEFARDRAELAGWKVADAGRISRGDDRERQADDPRWRVGDARDVHRADGEDDGQAERAAAHLPDLEPDVEGRVHRRAGGDLVGRAGHRGHREPFCAGRPWGREAPDRPVQQRLHLPGNRPRRLRLQGEARQRRDVPGGGQGPRHPRHRGGHRRIGRLSSDLDDSRLLPFRRLRRHPVRGRGRARRRLGPGEPRRGGPAGDVVPRVPPHPLRAAPGLGPAALLA